LGLSSSVFGISIFTYDCGSSAGLDFSAASFLASTLATIRATFALKSSYSGSLGFSFCTSSTLTVFCAAGALACTLATICATFAL
jgi:hypothetical protein